MTNNNKLLVRIGYIKKDDAYAVLASEDGGKNWHESMRSKCQYRIGENTNDEPMYVHLALIVELKNYIANGYTVIY